MREPLRPLGGEADGAAGGHLDEGEHLAGLHDEGVVAAAANLERAPEAHPLDGLEPAMDDQDVAEHRGLAVIDLRADDDRVLLALRHRAQPHADLLGKQRARDLDETEVRDVMHDRGAVGVEKHDLRLGLDGRRFHGF